MSYIDSHIARIFLKNNLMVHLQRCILYLTATQLTRNFIFASQIMIMKQNVPCEYKESTLTFVSNSMSSVVAFFSYPLFVYPRGGNGKQCDIAQSPDMSGVYSL